MAAKKSIDSWKQKKKYSIIAPESFDSKVVGATLASDPSSLVGRTISVSVKDFMEARSKQHMMIKFKVNEVKDDKAFTQFKSFEMILGYLKSKIRKGSAKVDYIKDFTFSDNKARIKITIIASKNITAQQRKEITSRITKIFENYGQSKLDQIIQLALVGKLGTEIYHAIKGVCQIHRVELYHITAL